MIIIINQKLLKKCNQHIFTNKFLNILDKELRLNKYDFNNSFFYGISGIGYNYLRKIDNLDLPDLSLFEI